MQDLTVSLAPACASAWKRNSSSLSLVIAPSSSICSLASSILYSASSGAFQAPRFALCAVALRPALGSFKAENGRNIERDVVIWALGVAEWRCDGEMT